MKSARIASKASPPTRLGSAVQSKYRNQITRACSSRSPGQARYAPACLRAQTHSVAVFEVLEGITAAAVPLFEEPETRPTAQLNSAGMREEAGTGDRENDQRFSKTAIQHRIHLTPPPRAAQTPCTTLLRYNAKSRAPGCFSPRLRNRHDSRHQILTPAAAPRSGTGRATAPTPGPHHPTRAGAEGNRRRSVSSCHPSPFRGAKGKCWNLHFKHVSQPQKRGGARLSKQKRFSLISSQTR